MNKHPLIAGLLLALALPAAQAKVALVIGNDAYQGKTFQHLDKAVNDANILGKKLTELGFNVIERHDLSHEAMRKAIVDFSDALKKDNEVGLFYYAGHGMQIDGDNFLIPIEAIISREFEVKSEAINADLVLEAMTDAKAKINIVILDACRENGFVKRGGARGLASIAHENTFIAYATQPNQTADDGIFMQYFAKWITEPLPIDQLIKQVISNVRDATNSEQVPSYTYNLVDEFYFKKPSIITPAPIPPSPPPTAQLPFEPPMVAITGGCFQMGSPASESDRDDDDERQHEVCVDDFEIGQYEVTKGQFAAFVAATHYQTEAEKKADSNNWRNPGYSQTDQHPVVYVSWNDANAYINWLNQQTHKNYHLPNEAQWEYAARAGTKTTYPWGNYISHDYANYGKDVCCSGLASGKDQWEFTAPVGSFAPYNSVYDMLGNVWEWTCSVYDKDYAGGEKQCPSSNDANSLRVLRGGSWGDRPSWLRPANRNRITPVYRGNDLGFRLSRM